MPLRRRLTRAAVRTATVTDERPRPVPDIAPGPVVGVSHASRSVTSEVPGPACRTDG